ncbi:MAG: AEC family transporter [Desulfomonilaceae bacterium]
MLLILNNLLPIFAIIGLGIFLKRRKWISDSFISSTDRLIYYIFFPALLFWKIGKPTNGAGIESGLILAVFITVFIIFLISLLLTRLFRMSDYEVGSFTQGCYRFSSYIGLALTFTALGDEGGRTFGMLIGFIIPFINVLVVSSMTWFSGETSSSRSRTSMVLKAVVSNPLIIACLAGIIYARLAIPFPVFVDNTLALMSSITLPLALVSIGGILHFSGNRKHLWKAFLASIVKLIMMPVIGYLCIKHFGVSNTGLQVAMIYFALPTSPQNYILSSQLNSDVDLATLTIVVSTFLSILSLSVMLILFV